ncbi:MAG TPA: hypothetical protein VLM89_17025 [Phycisphaerae bacterium]|nr:hypothetical protein [Phycisphaerae bacterium]
MQTARRKKTPACLLVVLMFAATGRADTPARPLLVFMQPADAVQPAGLLSFQANPLMLRGSITLSQTGSAASQPTTRQQPGDKDAFPSFLPLLAVPDPKGGCLVFGCQHVQPDPEVKNFKWRLYRGRTPDGYHLTELTEVFQNPENPQGWLIESSMVRQESTGRLYFYIWSRSKQPEKGHALWGFLSDDGLDFKPLSNEPLYLDHDAFGMMWDVRTNRFLTGQVTYQPWKKLYPDNMGPSKRRVLSIRTSPDGLHWDKAVDAGAGGLITPDDQDPPEVEFYRMQPFAYGDRYVAMANLYAATPLIPGQHGPHLGCEWWIGPDGIRWDRPWRNVDAHGDAPYPIKMAPMWFGKEMLFWIGKGVWGLPEYRIASIGSRANAEFSTRTFTMPPKALLLNASVPRGSGLFHQAYVQAELRDETGKAIPGYERDKCLLRDVDDTRIPLRWGDRTGTELAGKKVSMRFFLRSARIYALAVEQ